MKKNKQQILAAAVARILRPLIRVLLRNGVSYGTFADIARSQFVEVARKEFADEGGKQTISRLAVVTGLTRKEVNRTLRRSYADDRSSADRYNRAARVVAGWRRDKDFLDPRGKPLVLPISGKGNSFQELVRRYSGDMPYRAVLDELAAAETVRLRDQEQVGLMDRAYIPKADESMKLHILGVDTAYLIDAIGHNLLKVDAPPKFQRKVLYDNLPDEALLEFRKLSRKYSQKLLEKLDRWLSDRDRDANPNVGGDGRNIAGLGIYYIEAPFSGDEAGEGLR
jgi:Family of unknown function (DUF6502)